MVVVLGTQRNTWRFASFVQSKPTRKFQPRRMEKKKKKSPHLDTISDPHLNDGTSLQWPHYVSNSIALLRSRSETPGP